MLGLAMHQLGTAECALAGALYVSCVFAAGWEGGADAVLAPPSGLRPLVLVAAATALAQACPARDPHARAATSGFVVSGMLIPLLILGLHAHAIPGHLRTVAFRMAWLTAVLIAGGHVVRFATHRLVRCAAAVAVAGVLLTLHRYRSERFCLVAAVGGSLLYVLLLRTLRRSFTEGEGLLVCQLAVLLCYAVGCYSVGTPESSQLRVVMVVGVFGALCIAAVVLVVRAAERAWRGEVQVAESGGGEGTALRPDGSRDGGVHRRRGDENGASRVNATRVGGVCEVKGVPVDFRRLAVYGGVVGAGAAATFAGLSLLIDANPFAWLHGYLLAKRGLALRFLVYYCAVLGVALPLAPQRFTARSRTIARKYFHLVALVMFIPTIMLKVRFLALAFSVAFALFAVVEALRIADVAPVSHVVNSVMATYLDEKDAGVAVLTHIYLLLGCAAPVWFIFIAHHGGIFSATSLLTALAGVAITGLGDACASVCGTRFGGPRWPITVAGRPCKKTVAGTFAMFTSVLLLQYLMLRAYGFDGMSTASWAKLVLADLAAALMEAATDQVDNLFLPLLHVVTLQLI